MGARGRRGLRSRREGEQQAITGEKRRTDLRRRKMQSSEILMRRSTQLLHWFTPIPLHLDARLQLPFPLLQLLALVSQLLHQRTKRDCRPEAHHCLTLFLPSVSCKNPRRKK